MVGFRGSTAGGTSVSRSVSLREQIARALQADLLLLHQPTPNAFILLDPNPPACHWVEQPGQPTGRQRFRVTLGSQHCTCSAFTRAGLLSTCPVAASNTVSPCVHVLFVMLRVLRLSLDDPRILKTSLENHEVEPLLQQFAKRRASNFRLSTADTSPHPQSMAGRLAATAASGSSVSSSGGGGLPKLVMPRPVMRANSLTSAARAPAAFRGGCGGATPPSAFTPPLHVLAAMRAAIGEGSECSELSSITRSIAPAATARCRCASHASSCEGGGGAASARGPKSRLSNGEEDEESDAAASSASAAAGAAAAPFGVRRPRTEPQPHHEVNNSRLDLLHSTSPRYSLSTTFRPIMDRSPSETDDQEEGTVSSSSQSSRLDALPPPPPPPPPPPHNFRPLRQRRSSSRHFSFSSAVAEEVADDESLERSGGGGGGAVSRVANSCCSTLTSVSRRTTTTTCPHSRAGCLHSAGGGSTGSSSTTITAVGSLCATTDSPAKQSLAAETVLCLLCHRSGFGAEGETVSASAAAVCSAPDCSANFHFACFDIWQEECVLETGYLYCPVCGRPWSAEATNREPTETPRIPLESTRQLTSTTSTRQTPETAETPAMPPSYVVLGAQEAEEREGDTSAAHVAASPASSSPAPTSASSSSCTASYFRSNPGTTMTSVVTAPSMTTPTTAAAVATSTPLALMSPTNIPLLCQKNGWAAWVSAFSEEVALGITSPYWPVRQSALRQVGKITICRLLMSRQQPPSPPAGLPEEDYQCHSPVSTLGPESLRMAFRLIQHLLSDPADEVFLAALCAFREILGYLICLDSETQAALQRAISPVLRRLLIFVGGYLLPGNLPINCHIGQPPPEAVTSAAAAAVAAAAAKSSMTQSAQDSLSAQESAAPAPPADARRRANLALATLVEFAKGQEGEMSIGRDTSNAAECMPISGVPHLAHFLLRSAKFHQTHLVGRLTLLEKLIQMHRAAAASSTAADSTQRRISYRHLCSSLIFARRHVYPPEQPVFPHNYVSEVEARRWVGYHRRTDVVLMTSPTAETAAGSHAPLPDSQMPSPMALQEVKFSSSGSLMEANLKASRLARRVFIAVCRALLAEPDAAQTSSSTGSQRLPCAEDFVNSELSCLDASLAGRFRSKLADVLRSPAPQHHQPPQQQLQQQQQQQQTVNQSSANLLSQHTQVLPTPPTIRLPSNTATITPSGVLAPDALPSGGVSQKQRLNRLHRLRSTDGVSGDPPCCSAERNTSAPFFPSSEEVPPMPPPRRLSQPAKPGRIELAPFAAVAPRNNPPLPPPPPPLAPLPPAPPPPPPLSPLTHMFPSSVNVRVAPEPAYDPVAISETGPYSSSESEEEEEEEDEGSECSEHKKAEESLEKLDWRTGHLRESSSSRGRGGRRRGAGWDCPGGEYIYQEPPQTTSEELAVLRKAVRRSGRLPTPLVSIPSLPVSMDLSVLKNDPAKASYAYKEGVDWLLGPFLGRGAFSQCFQARDIRTGTLMAVKRLRLGKGSAFPMQEICGEGNPAAAAAMRPAPAAAAVRRKGRRQTDLSPESGEQLAAVQAEVAIMQRINHPNVLRFYGITFNPLKKQVDVFVEWMPGGSITSLLDQYGAFTEPVALAFILQVVRGLSCLHRHRILHRDLKGANLLVDATGSIIRISDFGASARLESQGSVSGQFQGQVIGTFAFMAPEVLRGEAYGRACDIWSVGCCLLEMLTGKPPWNDSRLTNQYALMFTIATAEHPPAYPKAISPAVKDFLDACFSRVPEQRPTARHLLLNPVFRDFTDSVESPGSSRSPPQCLSKSVSLPLSAVNEVRSSSRAPRALPPVPDSPNGAPPVSELCSTYDKLVMSFSHHKTPVTTSVGGTSSSKLSRRGC